MSNNDSAMGHDSETIPSPARMFCRFCGHGPLFSWELHEPGHCKNCARTEYDLATLEKDEVEEDARNWSDDE